ncbi:MAG: hypothetical protein CMF72_24730 [Mameliella sp.]|nr:hypothetical protein [Mameliella sp.]
MSTSAVELEVIDLGVAAALSAFARSLDDVGEAWEQVGTGAREAAVPFVPVASGALVDSLTSAAGPQGVEVSSDLPYAGVIDQGWPARNIAGSYFMDEAEQSLESSADVEIADVIHHTIDRLGLS